MCKVCENVLGSPQNRRPGDAARRSAAYLDSGFRRNDDGAGMTLCEQKLSTPSGWVHSAIPLQIVA
ncbi:MAG: hypothetical protein FWG73_06170 [Planctomycetaceae bacterium]|nr:hypothetical protein [Planctomycetaceae bacterium]